jgi:hypothetical protein
VTVTVERESAPIPEKIVTGTMRIADHTGDTVVTWDKDNPAEVEIARASFEAGKRKRHLAYRVGDGRRESEVMRDFDPAAEHIVLMPQTVGG